MTGNRLETIGEEGNHSRGLAYSNLAVAQESLLRFRDADENYKRALTEKEHLYGREHLSAAVTRGFYGYFLTRLGGMPEAIDLMRESLATMQTQPEAMRRVVEYRVRSQLGVAELNYGLLGRGATDIEAALAAARRQESGSNTTLVVTTLDEQGAGEALEWLRARALVVQWQVALSRHDETMAGPLRSAHEVQARLLAAESPRLAATRSLLSAIASAK